LLRAAEQSAGKGQTRDLKVFGYWLKAASLDVGENGLKNSVHGNTSGEGSFPCGALVRDSWLTTGPRPSTLAAVHFTGYRHRFSRYFKISA
jgi:hypothetical protein